jgi:error-prone DNA polymerase
VFATIEDETGIANIVIWPAIIERDRRAVVGAALLLVVGRVQRSEEGIVHVVAERLEDRSAALRALDAAGMTAPLARADEVARPQSGRDPKLPRSRDFH